MQVQAAVMLQPGQIEIREFDKPTPADDSLLLQVDKVGICGSDKHMYLGHTALKFPVIPGHEVVGTVAEIGKNANQVMNVMGGPIKTGDRITVVPGSKNCGRCYYCLHVPGRPTLCSGRTIYGFSNSETPPYLNGEFSEYTYIHGNSWVYKIPADIPEEVSVLTEPVAVATRAVERACAPGLPQVGDGYSIGSSVAVLGCGPIGLLVIAVLRDSGAGTIIATDLVDSRLEMAEQMGADVVINVGNSTPEERVERIQSLTNGVGVDIAIECAGIPAVFSEALDVVRRGAKVIEVGHYTDSGDTQVRPHQICNKDLDVCGVWAYPQIQFQTALDFLQRTRAPLHKLITHHLPLNQLETGIDMLGKEGVYKIVIEPQS
ncbi:MAG: zinc-binding dehydrogenase [Candidatus Poribacteria bacterium]|nr:zinc-binding dehydrogenase [Candidatus Poribacteria bacterium]